MIFFGSSKILVKDLYRGFTDIHSHILPGVDDGVRTLSESLQLLSIYSSLGVKKLWLTPHIMEDIPNSTDELVKRFNLLLDAFESRSMEIGLSAEYMLDSLFLERLKNGDLLPHGDYRNHLLVETSYFNAPSNLNDIVDDILSAGYFPILAHPERYTYMGKKDYIELKERKVLFQLNIPSLAGMYGESVKLKAEYLLKHSMYDFAGSDIHSAFGFDVLLNTKIKHFGKELF